MATVKFVCAVVNMPDRKCSFREGRRKAATFSLYRNERTALVKMGIDLESNFYSYYEHTEMVV